MPEPTTDLAADIWKSASATQTSVEPGSMSHCLFWEHAHRHRLRFRRSTSWPTESELLELDGADPVIETHVHNERASTWVLEGVLVLVELDRGRVSATLASNDEAAADRVLGQLREALPEPVIEPDKPRASFAFAWKSRHGLSWMSRALDVDPWEDVADNYPTPTRVQLGALATEFRAERPGQTIVWHGEPGTGKTNALRALAWEWREWCDVQLVTDPDQLFGQEAGYLMELLSVSPRTSSSERYRLVVLEDAGELLAHDARRVVGQGLSRFLNVCDGLLGQAEKVLLLVTTNEPLSSLHPAVRRPGRCAAEVEFLPLSVVEANAWLAKRSKLRVERATRLCDLYAMVNGFEVTPREAQFPIGFAA